MQKRQLVRMCLGVGWIVVLAVPIWGEVVHPAIAYLHPRPQSQLHSPGTTVILKLHEPYRERIRDLTSLIRLEGEKSSYAAEVFFATDGNTVICKPEAPFGSPEEIAVTVATSQFGGEDYHYVFSTASKQAQTPSVVDLKTVVKFSPSYQVLSQQADTLPRVINGVAVPSDFPEIVTIRRGPTAPGMIFYATNYPKESGNYLIACQNDGTPYFYRYMLPYNSIRITSR